MATSGSVDFIITRNDILTYALLNVGGIEVGVSPSSAQLTAGAFYLNMLMKAWHNDGMPLWALKEGYILPVSDTNQISLGPSGGHATLSYDHTTVSSGSGSSITVEDASAFSASDNIGIEQDDGSIHWTTINGAPAGNVITLTTALSDTADSGNHVWGYTTKIQRPIRIIEASRFDITTGTDVTVDVGGHKDYFEISTKSQEGEPNRLWYDPQLLNGIANIWPRFQNGKSLIKIWFHRPFEDFDGASDNPDCPQEFYLALVWQLSWLLSPGYGVPLDERRMWLAEAKLLKDDALAQCVETGSVRMQPSDRRHG